MTILLHTIAAFLWVFALLLAAVGAAVWEDGDKHSGKAAAVIVVFFAIIAFTLQVLA